MACVANTRIVSLRQWQRKPSADKYIINKYEILELVFSTLQKTTLI